jgi:hypothetical protein
MSDFDTVLERLVTDPAFAAALAANPDGALAGYRLSPDEVDLLHSQVGGDAGVERGVEVRANQSSVFGMLSPLTGLAGGLTGIGEALPSAAGGASPPSGLYSGGALSGMADRLLPQGESGIGDRIGGSFGPAAPATSGFGGAEVGSGFGGAESGAGFGAADPGAGVLDAGLSAVEAEVAAPEPDSPLPGGFHTRVDFDVESWRVDGDTRKPFADGGAPT